MSGKAHLADCRPGVTLTEAYNVRRRSAGFKQMCMKSSKGYHLKLRAQRQESLKKVDEATGHHTVLMKWIWPTASLYGQTGGKRK
eukprot:7778181-Heterocapsa_arctica.AAC.1